MAPQPAERRVLVILWLAMAASIAMYFVVIQRVQPTRAHENPALLNGLMVAAIGLVGTSFLVKSRIRAARGERPALLIALALCEAAALCGLVVWFNTAWPYYYVFLLLGLAGQLLHYPGGQDQS